MIQRSSLAKSSHKRQLVSCQDLFSQPDAKRMRNYEFKSYLSSQWLSNICTSWQPRETDASDDDDDDDDDDGQIQADTFQAKFQLCQNETFSAGVCFFFFLTSADFVCGEKFRNKEISINLFGVGLNFLNKSELARLNVTYLVAVVVVAVTSQSAFAAWEAEMIFFSNHDGMKPSTSFCTLIRIAKV